MVRLRSLVLPGCSKSLLLSTCDPGYSRSIRAFVILCSGFVVRIVDGILGVAPGIFEFALDLLRDAFELEWGVACQLTRLLFNGSRCFIYRTFYSVFVHWSTFRDLILVASIEGLEIELYSTIKRRIGFEGQMTTLLHLG